MIKFGSSEVQLVMHKHITNCRTKAQDALVVQLIKDKSTVVDFLYSKIDLSKYRYNILNHVDKLKFLQENIHFVSPNYNGFNYLIIFMKLNNENVCIAIDRKKLSYHKNQLDMNNLQILKLDMKTNDTLYNGTIFDGKLINNNNKYIFLIQDCFYMMGNKLLNMNMKDKMTHLNSVINNNFINSVINNNFKDNYSKNIIFKINKLYNYDDIETLVNKMDTLEYKSYGLIFFPQVSGITTLHIEKKDTNINTREQNINTREINNKKEITINNRDNIEQKTYNIITNFVNFLKNRIYSYEENGKTKILSLSKTEITDVYDIFDNTEKLGIALIPNLRISHMCSELITDKPIKFKCVYCNKFKKWIPLNPISL
jgi:hypothetical protein